MHQTLRRTTVAVALALAATMPASAGAATPTTIFSAPQPGTVETDGSTYLLTQAGPTGATLLVGEVGMAPTAHATTGLPTWARPHLGTSAGGHRVVVYPSCATNASGCDLRVLDLSANRTYKLKGAGTSREELEGDLDRGAAAWLVASKITSSQSIPGYVPEKAGSVRYRPANGAARTLPGDGGMELSLDRGRVLLVRRSYQEGLGGEGGAVIIDILRTTGVRTRITAMGSGEDFQRIEGPRFVAKDRVAWAMVSASGSWLKTRSVAASAKTSTARIIKGGMSVAPLSTTSVLALQGGQYADWTEEDGTDVLYPEGPFSLVRITGLTAQ
ncbi:MAG: hypothetical protein J7513_10825 [Solirubrobacteraceae bacterium]|nr:hypothetical protein [Solirubrobacteraceae bacterium]